MQKTRGGRQSAEICEAALWLRRLPPTGEGATKTCLDPHSKILWFLARLSPSSSCARECGWPLETGKGPAMDSALEGRRAARRHLTLSPVTPVSDFRSPKL